jgi:hypothetical protein
MHVGDIPDQGYFGIGNGDVDESGMGTFSEAIGSLAAGKQLDELNRSMSMLHDGLRQMIELLGSLYNQHKEVEKLAKMPGNFISIPIVGSIPTPQGVEVLKAQRAVKDGYTRVTAYVFQMDNIVALMKSIEPKVAKVYGGVSGFINAYYQWKTVFGEKLWSLKWTGELFQKMSGELWGAWLALGGSSAGYNYNDPKFLQATNIAVERVTGIKAGPTSPAGLGALGLEPISTTVAVILLVKTIIAVLAVVAIVVGVVALAKEFNAKAIKIAEVRQQYEANLEAQRKEYVAKRTAEGAPVATATNEWEKIRTGSDERQKKVEESIAAQKGLPDVAGDFLTKLALPLILVGGAVLIIPMVAKK